MLWVQLVVISVTGFAVRGQDPTEVFGVTYEWNKLDFTWPDDSFKARFLDSSQFIPENTTISGVKVWRDRLYVTLPRWRRGVPVTLASVPLPTAGRYLNTSPKLEPFPSWEMQHVGNCSALQNVQNVEIHPDGYMWVIDSGRVDTLSQHPDSRCAPKIFVFDLSSGTSSSPGYNSYDTDHRHENTERNHQTTGYYQGGYNPSSDLQGRYNPPGGNQGGYNPSSGHHDTYNYPRTSHDGYNPPSGNRDGYNPPSGHYDRYNPPSGNQGGYNAPGDNHGANHSPRSYNGNYNRPGVIVREVTFPDSVISRDTYLEDIVLDTDGSGYTYISDSSENDPGLIVYSWKENRSWKVRDGRSMRADPGVRSLSINGVYVDINRNIAGLALSPVSDSGQRRLYYSPLGSYSLFSIPTSVLRDETHAVGDVSGYVKTHGRKRSISQGMVMDSHGVLYYGLLGENAITKWDTNLPFEGNQHKIAQDNNLLQWPASFGFDSQLRNLTVVSNRLQNFLSGRVHLNEPNFRIITAFTGTKSYLYPRTGIDYATSSHRTTEILDGSFSGDRNTIHQSRHEHITGNNHLNAGGRMTPILNMIAVLVITRLAVA
ncbi:protein yellow [Cryptotermes secundus]|uniref:protein yellow n=1 Tax=Cryptotermes secundus TaxID=105785 RepID=UPI000CD7B974|nr:protein yellow [Cryptotermes secundus]